MTHGDYLPRGEELDEWERMLVAASGGAGGALGVAAPPGFGKTRLLDELASRAGASNFVVLRGAGRVLDRNTAHSATRQLFERIAGRDVAQLYDGVAGLARPLLEEGRPVADQFAQTHALFWLLANLAERGPVALVVDDAQWLDSASASFIAYVVERAYEIGAAVVVAARPRAFQEDPTLALIRGRALKVDLGPLSPAQAEHLVRLQFPDAPPEEVRRLVDFGQGNALMIEQLSAASRAGLLDHRATPGGELEPLVARRLAELGPAGRALVNAAAVVGSGGDWGTAVAISGLDPSEVSSSKAEVLDSQLVLEDPFVVRFVHVLVSDAVLTSVPAPERSSLHRSAGWSLVGRGQVEAGAVHLALADPGGDAAAVRVLLDQAGAERALGAPENAVRLLRRALAEPAPPDLVGEVTLALGDALLAVGQVVEASELLGRAVRLAADGRRTAAAQAAARALVFAGDPAAGVRLLEQVGGELTESAEATRQLRAELTAIGQTEHDLAATQQVPTGDRGSFDQRAATAMQAYDRLIVWEGTALDQVSLLEAVVPDAVKELGIDSPLTGMLVTGLIVSGGPGWPTARRLITDSAETARAEGSAVALATFSALGSRLAFLEGRLRDAHADGDLAVELASRSSPLLLPFAVSGLVMALCVEGELDEADSVLDQYGFGAGDVPPTAMGANLLLSRVMVRRTQGRTADAMADLERIQPFARGRAPWPSSWTPEMVRVLRAAGEEDRARQEAARHLEAAITWGAPLHLAEALLLQAELDPDEDLLVRALDLLDTVPAVLSRVRGLTALGALRRRAGDRSRAQTLLLEALEAVDQVTCAPLVLRIREELAACGLRPRRAAQHGVAALTASELRTARLAARGLSNGEIAQDLYLSLKTVENHLTKTYAKLGITSRNELTRFDLAV